MTAQFSEEKVKVKTTPPVWEVSFDLQITGGWEN